MGNNNYQRGAAFERTVKDFLEQRGWLVVRAAGSHGLVDVLAVDTTGRAHLIQCKTGKAKMKRVDWEALVELGNVHHAHIYEVTPANYKEIL